MNSFESMNSDDKKVMHKIKELATAMVNCCVKEPKLLVFKKTDKVPDNFGLFIGERVLGKTPLRTRWAYDRIMWERYVSAEDKIEFILERYGDDLSSLRGKMLLCNCGCGETCHGKLLVHAYKIWLDNDQRAY